jgi:Tol biopolymer transport system component
MDRDGQNKNKITDGYLSQVHAVSPSNQIVFSGQFAGTKSIAVADFWGGTAQVILTTTRKGLPQWLPGEQQIVFPEYIGPYGDTINFYRVNLDQSNLTLLKDKIIAGYRFSFHIAPTGKKIAYVSNEGEAYDLHVLDINSSSQSLLINEVYRASGYHYPVDLDWSRDASKIFYSSATDSCLYSIDAAGGTPRKITNKPGVWPFVSSEGNEIAFTTWGAGGFAIVVSNLDGSSSHVVLGGLLEFPTVGDFY